MAGTFYRKGLREPHFSNTMLESKTVEGKLNRFWVSTLQVSDRITWYDDTIDTVADILANRNTVPVKSCSTVVTSLASYPNFRTMLEAEGLQNVLPNTKSIDDGIEVYRGFYSEADEKLYGVMAIRLSLASLTAL